jgi:hypothetical protein
LSQNTDVIGTRGNDEDYNASAAVLTLETLTRT